MHNGAIRRNLFLITAIRGISSSAYYLFIPFFGIWLMQRGVFTLIETSLIVGVCIFTTRAASVIMPFFVRKIGEKAAILSAYLLTALVFLAMNVIDSHSMWVWQVMSGLLGVAFSVGTLGMKALIAKYFDETRRISAFSYLNVAVNVGAAVGPAAGGFVMSQQAGFLPLIAMGMQFVAAALAFLLPHVAKTADAPATVSPNKRTFGISMSFLVFLLVSSLTWVAYVQLYNVFPLYATGYLDERLVGALFSINAILIILVQIPVGRYLDNVVKTQVSKLNGILFLSNILMALSMLCLASARTDMWYLIFLGIVLFTLSELLWSPLYDAAVMKIRGGLDVITAFGISGLIWGLAESAGTSVGMALGESKLSPFIMGMGAAVLAAIFGYSCRILEPKTTGPKDQNTMLPTNHT